MATSPTKTPAPSKGKTKPAAKPAAPARVKPRKITTEAMGQVARTAEAILPKGCAVGVLVMVEGDADVYTATNMDADTAIKMLAHASKASKNRDAIKATPVKR